MARDDRGPHVLAMDALFLATLLTAVLADQSWLVIVALVLLTAIFWTQGALRFHRTRRLLRDLARAGRDRVRDRKPSTTTVIRLSIVVGAVALIVILNRLQLSAPGEGRGLSLELSGLQLGFTGVNTTGDWLAAVVTYLVLVAVVGAIWWRIWTPVRETAPGMTSPYFVCLGLFLLMPAAFALLVWPVGLLEGWADSDGMVYAAKTIYVIMGATVAAAIALPYGPWTRPPKEPRPTPDRGQENLPAPQPDRIRVSGD